MQPTPKYRSWSDSWEVYFPKRGAAPAARRFYPTEEKATTAISTWAKGSATPAMGQRAYDAFLYAESLLPPGVVMLDAVRFYNEHNQGLAKVTVEEVAKAYKLDIQRSASATYYREQARVVDEVAAELGLKNLFSSVGKARCISIIKAPDSYWNRYGRKRAVSCLITKARELDALRSNPLDGWKFEDAPKATPHTLKLASVQAILEHVLATAPELVASFALQLFSGIRTEELCRPEADGRRPLRWEDLTFGKKIEVSVEVSKTEDRRVITFWPEALTHWLNAIPSDRKGNICPVAELDDAKSKLLSNFEEFRQNDFRRTYASNAYALHGALVQDWMGHSDGRMLKKHYRDHVEEADAKLYFGSKPAASHTNVIALTA